jgi:hypothetical protein
MSGRNSMALRQAQLAAQRLGIGRASSEPLGRAGMVEFITLVTGQRPNAKLLQRWLREGRIAGAYRWGSRWRCPPEALLRFLDTQGAVPNDAA